MVGKDRWDDLINVKPKQRFWVARWNIQTVLMSCASDLPVQSHVFLRLMNLVGQRHASLGLQDVHVKHIRELLLIAVEENMLKAWLGRLLFAACVNTSIRICSRCRPVLDWKAAKTNGVQVLASFEGRGVFVHHLVRSDVRMSCDELDRHVRACDGPNRIKDDINQTIAEVHVGHNKDGIVVQLGDDLDEPILLDDILNPVYECDVTATNEVVEEAER
mmetsp:Transcript_18604/g.51726  ORF Transcript_18604/g.51726 Transcript_18604/m.51726 type:complete len:218 (+) Transcript_18604:1072-1725(+)